MCHARMGLLLVIVGLVTSCGGGSSNGGVFNIGGGNIGGPGTGNGMNTLAVIVDGGPAAAGGTVNTLFTSVTICVPGSASECQTIDHVQVDTGSTGFRVLASVLGNGLTAAQLPQASDGNGNALNECVQFADGYSWGAVRTADLILGSETAAAIPIHVVGDPAAPPVPASCVTGPEENTVQSFGANGILGIGNFLTDCGMACETGAIAGTYYGCDSSANCLPVAISVTQQLQNPVSLFAVDNNGVVLSLPSVATPSAMVNGTLIFGIGTQSDNVLGTAQVYTVDPNFGTFSTTYQGTLFGSSFLDAGASGYFFSDGTMPTCADQPAFYCPASTVMLNASIQDTNGAMVAIAFAVDNADVDFATGAVALPNLAGPTSGTATDTFDWGLPFFYGRSVYVAFEAGSPAGVAGPWVGF
jgi:Protein of unknown function (DUF3443)